MKERYSVTSGAHRAHLPRVGLPSPSGGSRPKPMASRNRKGSGRESVAVTAPRRSARHGNQFRERGFVMMAPLAARDSSFPPRIAGPPTETAKAGGPRTIGRGSTGFAPSRPIPRGRSRKRGGDRVGHAKPTPRLSRISRAGGRYGGRRCAFARSPRREGESSLAKCMRTLDSRAAYREARVTNAAGRHAGSRGSTPRPRSSLAVAMGTAARTVTRLRPGKDVMRDRPPIGRREHGGRVARPFG